MATLYDRIKETTATTGIGTYTLAGAVTGFEAFTTRVANGEVVYYAATDGTDWEVGIGTFTAAGTLLARTTILYSSNTDTAVSWSAGNKDIWVNAPAELLRNWADGGTAPVDNTIAMWDGTTGLLQNTDMTYNSTSNQYIHSVSNTSTTSLSLINTNAGAVANAVVSLLATGGDVRYGLGISGGASWHLGIDNSAADDLIIGRGNDLGTTPTLTFKVGDSVHMTMGTTSSSENWLELNNISFNTGADNPAGVDKGIFWNDMSATGGVLTHGFIYRTQSTGNLNIGAEFDIVFSTGVSNVMLTLDDGPGEAQFAAICDVKIASVVASTSAVTGALTVAGGVGILLDLFVDGGLIDLSTTAAGALGPTLIMNNLGNAVGDASAIQFLSNNSLRAEIRSTVEGSPFHADLTFSTGITTLTERVKINATGLAVEYGASGGTVAGIVSNTTNAASSHANHLVKTAGTLAGDPFTTWTITGGDSWSMGVDNSDADAFNITPGANLSDSAYWLRVTPSGAATIISTIWTQQVSATGAITNTIKNTDNASTSAHARFHVSVGGTAGGDPFIWFDIPGVTTWSMGADNSDGDSFVISNQSFGIGTNNYLRLNFTDRSVAIGFTASAPNVGAIAIGDAATIHASAVGAIAIGDAASANNAAALRAIAIGVGATATALESVAIGDGAGALGTGGIAIGDAASSNTGVGSIAIGDGAVSASAADNCVVIGAAASATGSTSDRSVAIGFTALAALNEAVAIGDVASAQADRSIAIGDAATVHASAARAIAIGSFASANNALALRAIAIGNSTSAIAQESICIGDLAVTNSAATGAISIGDAANTNNAAALRSIAIGVSAHVDGLEAIAIGDTVTAHGEKSIAIGDAAIVNTSATSSIAIGGGATIAASVLNAIAIGGGSATVGSGATNAIAFGSGSNVEVAGSIAIGASANVTSADACMINVSGQSRTQIFSGSLEFNLSPSTGMNRQAKDLWLYLSMATTNATPTTLREADNTANSPIIPASTVWKFDIDVVARRSGTVEVAAYNFRDGVLERDAAGNTTMRAAPTKNVLYEADANLDVGVTADDTNEALAVTVTGIASETWYWLARVRILPLTA